MEIDLCCSLITARSQGDNRLVYYREIIADVKNTFCMSPHILRKAAKYVEVDHKSEGKHIRILISSP
jgi:hypothetical protein